MGTRSIIARKTGANTFIGRYHHWDGYPSGVGKTLYHLYNEQFDRDLQLMFKVLLEDHPAGWSTINGADFSQPIGYGSGEGPQCYCHGERSEPQDDVRTEQEGLDEWGTDIEYVYVLDQSSDGDIMFCCQQAKYVHRSFYTFGNWKAYYVVALDGPEPDWQHIDALP